MKKIPQDVVGNIALLKFSKETLLSTKKKKANEFLAKNKGVTTVLEKTNKFSGRLRTLKTKYLAGIKTKETNYRENDCLFRFNVDEAYFSPRLSNERKLIAQDILKLTKREKLKILIMFAGVAPYPIVLAKTLKRENKKAEIYSNEINRKANIYALRNIEMNKLQDYVSLIKGDAKKISKKINHKFDIIIMTRPNLKETFLKTALKLSKKGTLIMYHGFGKKEDVLKEIKDNTKNKIGNIKIRKAGDIGPHLFRWHAEFKVK